MVSKFYWPCLGSPPIRRIRLRIMRFLPALRRLRAIGAVFLLAVWAVNPSLYLLGRCFEKTDKASSVRTNAIEAPAQRIEVCAHHHHGCPKDCLCPKVAPLAESHPKTTGAPETIREPSLSQCSEARAAIDSPPVVTAFLIPAKDLSVPCLVIGSCPIPRLPALLDIPRDPPQKIPIA